MKKFSSWDWLTTLVIAFFICSILARPEVYNVWQYETRSNQGNHAPEIQGWVTVALTFFTLLVLIFQAIIFRNQLNIFKVQASNMAIQSDEARKQGTLAHQAYLAANRPKLRIRNVVIHRTTRNFRDSNAQLFCDYAIHGQCYVSNIGGTRGIIFESHLILYANQMGLPMERPYEGDVPNMPIGRDIIICAGGSHPIPFIEINPLQTATGEPGRVFSGEHPFFVMGWVSYKDDNGSTWRTAFCRKWDTSKRRFVHLQDDPDYEHEG